MDARLSIQVGADVSNATKNLGDLSNQLSDAEKELNLLGRAIDIAISKGQDISKLEDAFQATSNRVKELKANVQSLSNVPATAGMRSDIASIGDAADSSRTGIDRLGLSTSQLRIAFIDLGRVVTGQGFSLRSLASNFALLGPAVAIGAAALYGLYEVLTKQTDAEKKAGEEAQKLKEFLLNLKAAGDITLESTGGEEGNIDRVRALAAAIQDTNKTYQERKNALDQLRETNKAYFGDLTLEAASLKTLAARVNEYAEALISEAVVKGQVEEISKVSRVLEEQAHVLDRLRDARDRANAEAAKPQASSAGNIAGGGADVLNNEAARAASLASDAYEKQREVVFKLRESIASYRGELNKAIDDQLKFKPLKDVAPAKDDLKSIIPILEEIKRINDELNKPDKRVVHDRLEDSIDQNSIRVIQAKIAEAFKKGIENGTKDPELAKAYDDLAHALQKKLNHLENPDLHSHIQPIADIDDKELRQFAEDAGKKLTERMHHLPPMKSDIKVELVFTDFERYQQDFKKKLDKLQKSFIDDVRDFTREVQNHLAVDFAKGLGDAFSGGGMKAAFNEFLQFLGSSIQKLGEQLIVAAGVFSAVDVALESLLTNPALAAAAGIAAIAVGQVIKNSFKATPFAEGGIVTGPTVGLVGEAGPEVIFPLNQLNRFIKNNTTAGGQTINVRGQISGRNLSLVMARDAKNQGLV